jgi:tRNA(Ile)-lysidine synthase
MHGILPKSGVANYMVRPLLFATKEELLLFSKENNLAYVEDSSNSSDKYTRNYFRNQLIPALKKVYPEVEDNLKRNIERFREIEILYDQAIKLHKQKLIEIKGDEVHIPILKLLKVNPLKTILYEIIKEFGFTPHQTDEVINILQRESGKYVSSSSHKIIKNRAWLIIAPINTLLANHILINENEKEINFEGGKIRIREQPITDYERLGTDKVMLDAEAIIFPLLLRKWKQGDYFYPLGMKGKKKLSKFFIDQKISLTDKERIWVIENNKKIIWIVGKRIDDRFKITDKTKKILSIELIK